MKKRRREVLQIFRFLFLRTVYILPEINFIRCHLQIKHKLRIESTESIQFHVFIFAQRKSKGSPRAIIE